MVKKYGISLAATFVGLFPGRAWSHPGHGEGMEGIAPHLIEMGLGLLVVLWIARRIFGKESENSINIHDRELW